LYLLGSKDAGAAVVVGCGVAVLTGASSISAEEGWAVVSQPALAISIVSAFSLSWGFVSLAVNCFCQ